jgi:hypothetical protein
MSSAQLNAAKTVGNPMVVVNLFGSRAAIERSSDVAVHRTLGTECHGSGELDEVGGFLMERPLVLQQFAKRFHRADEWFVLFFLQKIMPWEFVLRHKTSYSRSMTGRRSIVGTAMGNAVELSSVLAFAAPSPHGGCRKSLGPSPFGGRSG